MTRGTVKALYDKGKGALLVADVTTSRDDGTPLFRNEFGNLDCSVELLPYLSLLNAPHAAVVIELFARDVDRYLELVNLNRNDNNNNNNNDNAVRPAQVG